MTCIVGWIEESKGKRDVWIGGDSAGVGGLSLRIRKDTKVFRNGDMLFGYTSSFRMGQLLRYSLNIPEQSKSKSDYEYMCTDFIDAVVSLFEKKKYSKINNNEITGGTFLVGYKGNLYCIEDDFQIGIPALNFEAVGCGSTIAMGAMHALRKLKYQPKLRIKKAIDAAAEFSAGVQGPYVIKRLGG